MKLMIWNSLYLLTWVLADGRGEEIVPVDAEQWQCIDLPLQPQEITFEFNNNNNINNNDALILLSNLKGWNAYLEQARESPVD